VVIMDMKLQTLLQALLQHAHPSESQRIVFMGWPGGQNEPEGADAEGSAAGGGGAYSDVGGGDDGSITSSQAFSMPPPAFASPSAGGLPAGDLPGGWSGGCQ
jgi:hypothetical protein